MLLASEMLTVAKKTLTALLEKELKNLKNLVSLSAKAEYTRNGNDFLARIFDVPSALSMIHFASSTL